VAQTIGFLVVKLIYLSLSTQLDVSDCIFLDLFRDLMVFVLLVLSDVSLTSEAPIMTMSTSRSVD
jgi:hypothetical protein